MNLKMRRSTAILLLVAILFINLFPVANAEGEVIMTPMVETAQAATATSTPTPSPAPASGTERYFMVVDSNRYANGSQIQMKGSSLSLSITSSDYTTPTDATIQWLSYDEDIIDVAFDPNNKFEATISAVGPGYAQLGAIVTYGGVGYQVYCQIYVPLELHETQNDAYDVDGDNSTDYGMLSNVQATDATKKTLQLAGPEATDNNRYFVKLNFVKYKNVTNKPSNDEIKNGLFTKVPAFNALV